jgi:hypothetical protein
MSSHFPRSKSRAQLQPDVTATAANSEARGGSSPRSPKSTSRALDSAPSSGTTDTVRPRPANLDSEQLSHEQENFKAGMAGLKEVAQDPVSTTIRKTLAARSMRDDEQVAKDQREFVEMKNQKLEAEALLNLPTSFSFPPHLEELSKKMANSASADENTLHNTPN